MSEQRQSSPISRRLHTCLHLRSEFKLMSAYAEAIEWRFGDGGPSGMALTTTTSYGASSRERRCAITAIASERQPA